MEPKTESAPITRGALIGCLAFLALCVAIFAFWIHSHYRAKAKEFLEWEQQHKARKEYAAKYIKLDPVKITKIADGYDAYGGSTFGVSMEVTNTGPSTLSCIYVMLEGPEDWNIQEVDDILDPDRPFSSRVVLSSNTDVAPGETVTVGSTFRFGTISTEASKPIEPLPDQLKLIEIDCSPK